MWTAEWYVGIFCIKNSFNLFNIFASYANHFWPLRYHLQIDVMPSQKRTVVSMFSMICECSFFSKKLILLVTGNWNSLYFLSLYILNVGAEVIATKRTNKIRSTLFAITLKKMQKHHWWPKCEGIGISSHGTNPIVFYIQALIDEGYLERLTRTPGLSWNDLKYQNSTYHADDGKIAAGRDWADVSMRSEIDLGIMFKE